MNSGAQAIVQLQVRSEQCVEVEMLKCPRAGAALVAAGNDLKSQMHFRFWADCLGWSVVAATIRS